MGIIARQSFYNILSILFAFALGGINKLNISTEKKVDKLLIFFSSVCAATAVQPIPFADIFILTPIQLYMGTLIAEARGYKFSMSEISKILSLKIKGKFLGSSGKVFPVLNQ